MAIMVMDWDFRLLAEAQYTSLQLTRSHFGLGSFELRTHPGAAGAAELQVGRVLFFSEAPHKAMLVEKVARKGAEITAGGKPLKGIVARRVCVPPQVDDGHFGWDRFIGSAEAAYHHYAAANLYAPEDEKRRIPRLYPDTDRNRGPVLPWQSRFGNLESLFANIGEATDVGWNILPDLATKRFLFQAVPGNDFTQGTARVVVSVCNHNALSVTHTLDETAYKTTAYVGGSGEDENRLILSEGNQAAGLLRREAWVDAGSIFERDMLRLAGRKKLETAPLKETLTAEVVNTGLARYGQDYDLGDKLIVVGEGMEAKTRLVQMRESYDENGLKLQATFGTEPVTAAQALRDAMQPVVR